MTAGSKRERGNHSATTRVWVRHWTRPLPTSSQYFERHLDHRSVQPLRRSVKKIQCPTSIETIGKSRTSPHTTISFVSHATCTYCWPTVNRETHPTRITTPELKSEVSVDKHALIGREIMPNQPSPSLLGPLRGGEGGGRGREKITADDQQKADCLRKYCLTFAS